MLFRESPRLAPTLVARALGFELPADADIQVTAAAFADLDPPEYHADVVLRVPDAIDPDRDRATRETFIVALGALLQQCSGELPVEVQARLDAADASTLGVWGRRVLTAASLADVFAPESK